MRTSAKNDGRSTFFRCSRSSGHRAAGFTVLELLIVIAVLGIVALITMPRMFCMIEKSHMARMLEELNDARTQVEAYEAELGRWPANLRDVYPGDRWPEDLVYCTNNEDKNSGHGNQWCTFFDAGNPSGKNEHGGLPGVGFILATPANLAPRCNGVDYFYSTCCGGDPIEIKCGEDGNIGHPGKGALAGSDCN